MDTVEIVVYLSVAVIIGGIVLLIVGKFNGERTYDAVKGLFGGKKVAEFSKVDNTTVVPLLYKTWQECGLGTVAKNITFQYTDPTTVDAAFIFADIKAQRLCGTLSSESQGCGNREDLTLTASITMNGVYTATCDPDTRTMKIS